MASFSLYWHTLRHLKPEQVFGRIWHRCYRPSITAAESPAVRELDAEWLQPAARRQSLIAADRVRFLNQTHTLAPEDWDPPERDRLWRYNLHYFDDLNAVDAGQRTAWQEQLVADWIRDNPIGQGTGWEPYPCSLRIVNWIKWSLGQLPLAEESRVSLAMQARWLIRRLEFHLRGNHLLANAKALIYAGAFFGGSEADGWLRRGLEIFEREIDEQILVDGGHFERSTMYQLHVLEDLLDLINLAQAYASAFVQLGTDVASWRDAALRMGNWMQIMAHPDGEISFFNDAAFGVEPTPADLVDYASRLGLAIAPAGSDSLRHLPDSGYCRLQNADAVCLVDIAPVGPDYLPGHAHADSLSLEFSLWGKRFIVNSGTSTYARSPLRAHQRSTAAHNTVTVNGRDSSEVWDAFRVARRARVSLLSVSDANEALTVEALHDGYRRLPGKNLHKRKWILAPSSLRVEDEITGNFDLAEARYHLHPEVAVAFRSDRKLRLSLPGGSSVDLGVTGGSIRLDDGYWYPEFGIARPNRCIVANLEEPRLVTTITWQPTT